MDNGIQLQQLLKNLELRTIIKDFIKASNISLIIEDLEENILLGQFSQASLPQYPVTLSQKTIGWVKGDAHAQVLANLLTYLVNQEYLVFFDDLTGIANRRYFDHYLWQEWRRCWRGSYPLTLLLGDLDYFKAYNDYYGHQAGDRCLRQVAQALNSVLMRPADLVARYGGEEFAIILPDTPSSGAKIIAHELCTTIQSLQIPHHLSRVNSYVTISIGITTIIPTQNIAFDSLLSTADLALYHAKFSGRNRYCHRIIETETVQENLVIES